MALNLTQKINRERRARGLRPWGEPEFQARVAALSKGALMRNLTFSLIFNTIDWLSMSRRDRVEAARQLRLEFSTASVFGA